MLRISDLADDAVIRLVSQYSLAIERVSAGKLINGSFWGEPEAGVVGNRVFVRGDTPVHSMLHEMSHIVCMTSQRRNTLKGNAGGDDLEECAVCYLQILLAGELAGAGRDRLMQDMDDWGYSFRLGSTRRWFDDDAQDALQWLVNHRIVGADGVPAFQLRRS
jgi:hypothetical protein